MKPVRNLRRETWRKHRSWEDIQAQEAREAARYTRALVKRRKYGKEDAPNDRIADRVR